MHLCWLRNDLRVHDNTALWRASQRGQVVAVYLITPATWSEHEEAASKVDFWLRNLTELSRELGERNIPLRLVEVEHWRDAPRALIKLAESMQASSMSFNDEYGVHEQLRDQAVADAFAEADLDCQRHVDQTLFRPGTLLTQSGSMYKVYSQFRKQAYSALHRQLPACLPAPERQQPLYMASDPVPERVKGFQAVSEVIRTLWPAGEHAAADRLALFTEHLLEDYEDTRDRPDIDGTSRLSAYLASGVISVRQCLHAAIGHNLGEFDSGKPGGVSWINELLWREFYKHILVCYAHVSRGEAFRAEYQDFNWRHDPEGLEAWRTGRTGIPIIDAAMRQMLATGWMHNRLRMLTAMFLCKNLLINWQEGERWFMRHLIDGDLAANNGGWQWSASTGTDSAPYFRVFNPATQAQKFDPDGSFIREWVPELSSLSPREIHQPLSPARLAELGYPQPIVDLKASRQRAIAAFRGA
ncbi:deoxyribodipyrimidine photo-lyase [Halopseudomonas xinjiangensis]|uniref:deoxyribodipyrimidine photo-lyase n=1 Tax=Halopseudomonas xinjiangensis TaxID=487184 RepID=UPI000B8939F1|nr:deoxyribodipyrimidine photo-lyase [Halopseudomonas xinjiangensis]